MGAKDTATSNYCDGGWRC